MNDNDVSLIDRIRSLSAETEWVEFKNKRYEPNELGEYISALANAACLVNQPQGYLVFGIENKTHRVTGTDFDPYITKAKGNQDLLPWLASLLNPNTGFEVSIIHHPDGRIVLFKVGPAKNEPVCFNGVAYGRVGSSKVELRRHPEKIRAIWTRMYDWSGDICSGASIKDLDPEAIKIAREQFRIKHPAQVEEIDDWDDVTFLNKARILKNGAITNAALLLLGRYEAASFLAPAVAKITWSLKNIENNEMDYFHFGPPFLLVGDKIQKRIRNLTIRALPSGTLFPQEITQYDPWVVREALYNCIAHQDYGLQGRITVVEYPNRLLLTNVGVFLPGDVLTVIHQDSPQPIYRNSFLADAMVELNMIDMQGGGIKRMFQAQKKRYFPLPDYDLTRSGIVSVGISGSILDEQYTSLLMKNVDIDLDRVILLDRIQKRQNISQTEHKVLKAEGFVEGRYPKLIISGFIAKKTDQKARHIRERGFQKKYYQDIIQALIREHQPISRLEIDQLIYDKLPEVLSEVQKKAMIHNLISELVNQNKIENRGSRSRPAWHIVDQAKVNKE